MSNGNGCLTIGIDLEKWKGMRPDERDEHTFYALKYLVDESRRNKLLDRLITLTGSILASLTVMAPLVWWMVTK